ncbi:MAG TPA: SpoIIE family protein phosphatase [Bacteroidales bacterium]|nr:SpoIIE family protein phosphatase [Bacteroidales bacterium]
MKKVFFQILLFVVFTLTIKAQEGAVPLTNFQESREIENQSWAICQNGEGMMMFANRRGIMTFDGQAWDFIRMPAVAYSLFHCSIDNRIYAGCDNNYGYLEKDEKGFYSYKTLSGDTASVGLIISINATDSTIWFYGETSISRHNLKTNQLEKRFESEGSNGFTGLILTPKNIFINVMSKGLFRIEADTLFPIVTGYLLENREVLFSLPYNNKMVLLGMDNSSLSLFDGIKFYDYNIKDDGYLSDNILTDGIVISDSLYAFSTVDGGAIVVERSTGKLRATVNYLNGLPDDEIYALAADNRTGLWISHQYGLTRAVLGLPAGNFTIYPGLSGNLTGSAWYNNELYISTSEGVFYLDKIRNYGEVMVMVKNERANSSPAASVIQQKNQTREQPKTKRGLFSRIFSRKESSESVSETAKQVQSVKENKTEPKYVRRKVTRLKSLNYRYRKVDGLNDKSKQLVSTPHGILVSTNNGLYVISDHKARIVAKEEYVNHISMKLSGDRYFVATSDGYFYVTYDVGRWKTNFPDRDFKQPLYSITSDGQDYLWAGGYSTAFKIPLSRSTDSADYKTFSVKNDYPNKYITESTNDTIFLFTEGGIYYYQVSSDQFEEYNRGNIHDGSKLKYIFSQPGIPWYNSGSEWVYLPVDNKVNSEEAALLKLFDDIVSITLTDNYLWIVSGNNQIYRVAMKSNISVKDEFNLFVKSATNEDGIYFSLSDMKFYRGDNTVYFELSAPGYYKQNSTQYQYLLKGVMDDWSRWSNSSTITLMPAPGEYTLQVRAKDLLGNISDIKELRFTIKAPFTQTTAFYVIILAAVLILILLITRMRERQLKNEKLILEEKVMERTREIQAQKEEITSSIEYASRIQMAMLPAEELFSTSFAEHFIVFRPRDIVSGDFYWIGEDEKHIFFTVADCTGHGVPGAFMSTLGISSLNEIITNKNDLSAGIILNLLRQKIKTSLHQTGKEGEAADGMDIAFCVLHKDRKKLEFAGAYNPLVLFQSGELKEYKGDRMPIGIYYGEKETFTNHEIKVKRGDTIYIFSDGMCDQFGGSNGLKYKIANLKKLLKEIYPKPMDEQRNIIEKEFEIWKGSFDQVDDIAIIGVRI